MWKDKQYRSCTQQYAAARHELNMDILGQEYNNNMTENLNSILASRDYKKIRSILNYLKIVQYTF